MDDVFKHLSLFYASKSIVNHGYAKYEIGVSIDFFVIIQIKIKRLKRAIRLGKGVPQLRFREAPGYIGLISHNQSAAPIGRGRDRQGISPLFLTRLLSEN